MVIIYEDSNKAVTALYTLRESKYEDKHLLGTLNNNPPIISLDEMSHAISIFLDYTVMLLPSIEPSMVPPGVQPLLVFVNVKSGGCQGLQLISSFRKLLNPYQVFDLDNGGPLPGCVKNYNIRIFSSCSIRVIHVYNVTLQSLRFPSHKGL